MVTFASLAVSAWGILVAAAAFLLVLSVVVFIHELGHFLVARWCGITVKTFSIGFGKEIFGITDSKGTASLSFEINSSYHVLHKATQRAPQPQDGPVKTVKFKVNAKSSGAYDTNFDWTTVSIYGEVERLPVGGVYLAPGSYNCQFFLTEESFHGSGGTYAGNWAAAMGAPISFEITAP